jgi:hypothetical protein
MGRCQKKLGQTSLFMIVQNRPEGSRGVRKVLEGTGKYRDDPGCLRKSRGFHNRCIHVSLKCKS